MKILFLSKRHYMARDLLLDRYGRFYQLPVALAQAGATVSVSCLSYYDDGDSNDLHRLEHGVDWRSTYSGRFPPLGMVRYYRQLCRQVERLAPQVIVGASDSIHAILAAKLARRYKLPCCVDLYDNFESYGQMRLPGLKSAFRNALRGVQGISVVSGPLRDYVAATIRPAGRLLVLENAVPDAVFGRGDRDAARRALGLPATGRLLGTAGSLQRQRDIQTLYTAFLQLAADHPDLYLVLAGASDPGLPVPAHPRVRYLGDLVYDRIPLLYQALDLGVVCNRDDGFGRYCYPQKLCEMLASDLPVVAAAVGVTAALFREHPQCLYQPGDVVGLARSLAQQLQDPVRLQQPVPTWSAQGRALLHLLQQIR